MDDEFDALKSRFKWSRILLALAAVISLVIAVLGAPGRHGDDGGAASTDDAARVERCLGSALDQWERNRQLRGAMPKPQFRRVAARVCEEAEREGVLSDDGLVERNLGKIVAAVSADLRAEARIAANGRRARK